MRHRKFGDNPEISIGTGTKSDLPIGRQEYKTINNQQVRNCGYRNECLTILMLHAIMNLKLLHIIGISLFSFYATGQKLNEISPSLLNDGIYLENTEVMIPWKITLDSIKNYGNPKVVHVRKNYTEAQWGSVNIFN